VTYRPEGFRREELSYAVECAVYTEPKYGGMVTVDYRKRGFRLGCSSLGPTVQTASTYEGRGWRPRRMKRPETIAELMAYTMRANRVEPIMRVKDLDHVPRGMRNKPVAPRRIFHRYEIKGGIRAIDVMAENVCKDAPLLRRLSKRG